MIAVGARGVGVSGLSNAGATYLYQIDENGSSSFLVKLTAPDPAESTFFGQEIYLDGNFLIVGVPQADTESHPSAGKAYIYKIDNDNTARFLTQVMSPDPGNR